MWRLYQTATKLSQRPSSLLTLDDPWTALQFDQAVCYFGIVIENALNERVQVGMGKQARWEAKYQLDQLLDPAFRLPSQAPSAKLKEGDTTGNGKEIVDAIRTWAGLFKGRGVKVLKG